MKLQKSFILAVLMSISTIFVSCSDIGGESNNLVVKPKVIKVTSYNRNGEEVPFYLGDTNIDPENFSYIDFKFDKAMNTNYKDFIYYGSSLDFVSSFKWINSYTYRLAFSSLPYSYNFKIVFNDSFYCENNPNNGSYNPKKSYLRDTEGNYLADYFIEFSTKKSPYHPIDFKYDISNQASFVELQYNEYGNPPNMQTGISIENLFLPESLYAGDTLKLKYKIRSDYDLPKIIVNLVDISEAASYWTILAKEENIPLTTEAIKASTKEAPLYYENEILFHIAKDMTSSCTIQFTCTDWNPESEDPIQFYLIAEKAE